MAGDKTTHLSSCSAEIFVENVSDAIFVPVHAVHRDGGSVWVWLQKGNGFSQQLVELGVFSESYASILSGLSVGDVVLLREPSASQVVGRLSTEVE